MGHIQNPDYETVTAECEHCGSLRVYNRIDDIGEPGPYAGRYIECLVCQRQFRVSGDTINPAYELLISSAREHFGTKRYMQCVALLAQAWELFFSLFLYSNYLYRPYFVASPELSPNVEYFNQLSSQLYDATRAYTFLPLRNALTNTVIKHVHPQTLQESETAIARIVDENFGANPKPVDIEMVPHVEERNLLNQLQLLKVGSLRNVVVHQHARRPRRAEVEECLEEEIEFLYRVKDTLTVFTFDYWSMLRNTGLTQ